MHSRLKSAGRRPALAAVLGVSISGLTLFATGCESTPTADEPRAGAMADSDLSDEPIEGEQATLTVYGLSCPKCATNIDRQLMSVPGVSDVSTGLSAGRVVVTFASDAEAPSRRQLGEAVRNSGFTLRGIDVP